jgi:hypothetical protein
MISRYYRLEGHEPVRVADLVQWAQHCDYTVRRIGWTYVGDAKVSTIFIGIDAAADETDPPQIFETAVIGGELAGLQLKSSTWVEAEAAHQAVCERLALAVAVDGSASDVGSQRADNGATERNQRLAAGVAQRAAGPCSTTNANDQRQPNRDG